MQILYCNLVTVVIDVVGKIKASEKMKHRSQKLAQYIVITNFTNLNLYSF